MKKLICIRHGKTPGNEKGCYIGRTEEELSFDGRKEILENQKKKLYPSADIIFTSPMKRCVQTAELIYGEQKSYQIRDFKEMDFGRFEGKNYKELSGEPAYQKWIDSNGTLPFPEGESKEAFQMRCVDGFYLLCEIVQRMEINQPIETISCVVHGGTIMSLFDAFSEGNYYDFQCKNGEGFTCLIDSGQNRIRFVDIQKLGAV